MRKHTCTLSGTIEKVAPVDNSSLPAALETAPVMWEGPTAPTNPALSGGGTNP